jgi:hypothetical protein
LEGFVTRRHKGQSRTREVRAALAWLARTQSIAAIAKRDACERGARSLPVISAKKKSGASCRWGRPSNLFGNSTAVRCRKMLLLLFSCLTGDRSRIPVRRTNEFPCYSRVPQAKRGSAACVRSHASLIPLESSGACGAAKSSRLLFACLTGENTRHGFVDIQANPGFFGKLGSCAVQQKAHAGAGPKTGQISARITANNRTNNRRKNRKNNRKNNRRAAPVTPHQVLDSVDSGTRKISEKMRRGSAHVRSPTAKCRGPVSRAKTSA